MKIKLLSTLKFLIGWPLALAALFFIFKLMVKNGEVITPTLKNLNLSIFIASIICFIFYFLLRTILWRKILSLKGHDLNLKEVSSLWAFSELKRYIPGNIWGFLGRTISFSEKNVPKKTIFSSLITEAQLVVAGAVISSLLFLPFILQILFLNFYSRQFIISFIIFAIIGIIFFIFNRGIINFFEKKKPRIARILKFLFTGFSFSENTFLLLISTAASFLFGFATYLSISSILYLTPFYIFLFTGFFIFSFLLGYLSLITPMGLGVREGAMATGLSKFMPISSAVFAAIFARVTFILSELIFIVISFILVKLKNKTILKIEKIIIDNKIEVFLVLSVIIYILYFTTASFLRFDNFYTGRFDLGNMDQTVWNTSLGRIFQMTDPDGTNNISRLSFHADFILILFAPFYWFLPDPRLLLFTQTFIVGFGAFFVFLLAKDILKNKSISFVLAISYLLNPALEYANLYDFHAVTLATTFLLGAFYFLRRKKYILFILFAILSALTKENVWLTVSFFGIYIIMQTFYSLFKTKTRAIQITKRQIFGILIFITSIAIFCYLVFNIIPLNRGGDHFALNYYSDFGSSPTDIIKSVIFSPQKTLGLLLQKERLEYLLQIFSPFGFLPILSLSTIFFAFPDLAINLLSNNSQLHQIYFQYTSIITPFLFIATIFAVRNIKKVIPSIPNWMFIVYLALFAIYSAHALGPLPGAKNPNLDMLVKPQQNKEVINNVLSRIEKKYTVAATNNLGSHLSRRQGIFTIPIGMDEAEVLAFLLNDPFAQPSPLAQKKMVEDYKKNKAYKIVYEKDDFIVFQKL